jgi:hypothetical protein
VFRDKFDKKNWKNGTLLMKLFSEQNLSFSRESIIIYPLVLFVVLLIMIPPSSFTGVKQLFFFLLMLTITFAVFSCKKRTIPKFPFYAGIVFLSYCIVNLLLNMIFFQRDFSFSFRQMQSIGIVVVTALLLIVGIGFTNRKLLFLKSFVYANLLFNMLKILLLFLPLVGVISFADLEVIVGKIVGQSVIALHDPTSLLGRISFGNDVFTPFAAMIVIVSNRFSLRFGKKFQWLFWCVSSAAVVITFTRYIWGVYIFVVVCGLAMKDVWKTLLLLFGLTILVSALVVYSPEKSTLLIRAADSASLDMKSLQSEKMLVRTLNDFSFTLFGRGIGTYMKDFTRNSILPYSYEAQYVGFIYKIGITGTLLMLLFLLSFISNTILKTEKCKEDYFLIGTYLMWLSSGIFNPYLFIWSVSLIYVLFYLLSEETEDDLDDAF